MLVDMINQVLDLNGRQKESIIKNYHHYRDLQVQDILSDPIKYYTDLKQEALKEI